MKGHLIFTIVAAAFGSSFQHGYNTGVTNAPQLLVEEFISDAHFAVYGTSPNIATIKLIFSVVVSMFSIGGTLGGICTAILAERFGRKGGLLLNNVLVFVAAAMMGFAKLVNSFELLIVGRFVIGVNSGINAGITPMYLSEISPVHLRGAIGTIYQLILVISIFISQLLGLEQVFGTAERWPLVFAITAVPAVFMIFTLPMCPESPKYTVMNRNDPEAAEEGLKWLRDTQDVSTEMDIIKKECEEERNLDKVTMKEMLTNKVLLRPLIISIVVMLSQQFSGINTVIYYSTDIFLRAGLSKEASVNGTLGIGFVNIVVTIISMGLMEKAGRRVLMLIGLIGMAVISVLLTVCIALQKHVHWMPAASVTCVVLFVTFFAIGPGAIPWFLVAELFGQNARPLAFSIAVPVNWLANFVVGISFLLIAEVIGEYTFLIFTMLLTLFSIYVYFEIPETTGKTITEITEYFTQLADGTKETPNLTEGNVSDSETGEKGAKLAKSTSEK